MVRAEALKVSRQLSFWLLLAGGLLVLGITVIGISTTEGFALTAKNDPGGWAHQMLDLYGTIFQIGSGIVLILIGSRLIAMEYSSGTIRIAYARGVGRLQLLLAKVASLAFLGIALLAGYLLVAGGIVVAMYISATGGVGGLDKLPADFWQDFYYWLLVQGMSIGIAILLASAAAGLGRALAFAMAASLAFFPIDNFAVGIMALTARATKHDAPWTNITEYLLGPNLNVVLNLIEPAPSGISVFAPPLNKIDGTHALLVIGVWAVVLAGIAVYRAMRPDVLE
jgi:ABC-2 type transport system permease protein